MTDPSRRRRRLTADEVRDRMLDTAQRIVMDQGITVSLEGVSLEDVMRQADVPRSSVYNLWPTRGQFVDAVLLHLARPDWIDAAGFGQRASLDLALQVVHDNRHRLRSVADRIDVQREATRVAIARNFHDVIQAKGWRVYFALASTVGFVQDPKARAEIAAVLQRTEVERVSRLGDFYRHLGDLLGLRPRPGYRHEHLALAGGALIQGMMLRKAVSENRSAADAAHDHGLEWTIDGLIDTPVPSPDGTGPDWEFVAAAYYGLFSYLTEPDPDWVPPEP